MLGFAVAVTTLLYLNRPPAQIQEPVYQAVTVDIAEVVKEDVRIQIQAQGTVSPLRETAILSEVNGRIVEVSPDYNVGGFITAGNILLRIDPRDYETQSLRAQAALKSAESSLAQEKGRADVAKREWDKLPKGSHRSQAGKDLYLRKPQLDQAQAQLLAAQADLNTAKDNLERTNIRAPYDALIRAKHSEMGKFVTAGTPLVDIFAIAAAEIRLPISQSKLAYLELPDVTGAGLSSSIDLYTDVGGVVKHWTASLHRTEGVFDERSRVLHTVARVDDPYGLLDDTADPLRVGTFVNANIEGKELKDVVPLPRYVLRAGNNLWVVDDTLHLRNRQVSILRVGGDLIYVSAGLDNGDLVSLTTMDSSFDGAKVRIQSQTPTDKLDKHGQPKEPEAGKLKEATAAVEPTSAEVSDG